MVGDIFTAGYKKIPILIPNVYQKSNIKHTGLS